MQTEKKSIQEVIIRAIQVGAKSGRQVCAAIPGRHEKTYAALKGLIASGDVLKDENGILHLPIKEESPASAIARQNVISLKAAAKNVERTVTDAEMASLMKVVKLLDRWNQRAKLIDPQACTG